MTKIIDVSEYQPNIDYAKVKAAGIGGAILRCGFTGWGSSHSLNKDTKFEAHYAGFTGAGIPAGAYYYSTADTVDFAKKEAESERSCWLGKKTMGMVITLFLRYCTQQSVEFPQPLRRISP